MTESKNNIYIFYYFHFLNIILETALKIENWPVIILLRIFDQTVNKINFC